MTALWTRDDAQQATGGTAHGPDWSANGVVIDSRQVAHGNLFVALPGERVDGHDYVVKALDAGASAALVSRVPEGLNDNAPLLRVPDVLEGLEGLAKVSRARSSARIAAVTGSVGKTGSKEMLAACLGAVGSCQATYGNLNNHIGAPLSLARFKRETEFGVFELGMNHANEIRPLSKMVAPHVAMITTVEPVHIEFFESVEGIADAKAEIFEGLVPGGVAVVNRDNPHYERLCMRATEVGVEHIRSFGTASGSDARLVSFEDHAAGTDVVAEVSGVPYRWRVGGWGAHWALNSVAVAITLHAMGVDLEACLPALSSVGPGRGRGGVVSIAVRNGAITLLDESYNASPPAVRAALAVFGATETGANGRRVAVLGDMRELGDQAGEAHAELRDAVVAAKPDRVFLVGEEMTALRRVLPSGLVAAHGQRSEDIADAVAASLGPGDVVLVKGSLGTNMKPIVAAIEALGVDGDGLASSKRNGTED